ncbi:hypothetical protein [Thermococcus sp.]
MRISPGALVVLFLEDFAKENKSIKKGVNYFKWQKKRYDAEEIAYSIVGMTLSRLVRDGYIRLELKKGLFGKKVVITRLKSIPNEYGVITRGINSMQPYKEVELHSALFLSFPVSPFPAAFLGSYIIQEELKDANILKLREDPEIVLEKERTKAIFETFKMQDVELWKVIKKETDKAFNLVRGKKGWVLYSPLDMLENKNKKKKGTDEMNEKHKKSKNKE